MTIQCDECTAETDGSQQCNYCGHEFCPRCREKHIIACEEDAWNPNPAP